MGVETHLRFHVFICASHPEISSFFRYDFSPFYSYFCVTQYQIYFTGDSIFVFGLCKPPGRSFRMPVVISSNNTAMCRLSPELNEWCHLHVVLFTDTIFSANLFRGNNGAPHPHCISLRSSCRDPEAEYKFTFLYVSKRTKRKSSFLNTLEMC